MKQKASIPEPVPKDYDVLFDEISELLPKLLPRGLQHIMFRHNSGDNWMVLRYPEFRYSHYELHFSKHSKNHAAYFGDGPVDVLAFYFGGSAVDHETRLAWLKAVQPFTDQISRQIGQSLVLGQWGKNWAWLATEVSRKGSLQNDPMELSACLSHYIQATYVPIAIAFRNIFEANQHYSELFEGQNIRNIGEIDPNKQNSSEIIYEDERIRVTTSSESTSAERGIPVELDPEAIESLNYKIMESRGYQIFNLLEFLTGSYYVFERNHFELLEYMNSYGRPFAFMTEWTPIMHEVTRLLHNFLSSAKSLVELTRNVVFDLFDSGSRFAQEYNEQIYDRFIDDPVTGFVEGLRNFSLHYRLPITSPWIHLGVSDGGHIESVTPGFVFFKGNLLSWENWPKKAKSFLQEADEQIAVEDIVDIYYNNVSEFHSWMHLRLRELYALDLEELEKLEAELRSLMIPKNPDPRQDDD